MADRTASSTRGFERPGGRSPARDADVTTERTGCTPKDGGGGRSPWSAACSARDSRRGTTTSWKHRPDSSVSGTCSAIVWRLRHADTTSSTEKETSPGARRNNTMFDHRWIKSICRKRLPAVNHKPGLILCTFYVKRSLTVIFSVKCPSHGSSDLS